MSGQGVQLLLHSAFTFSTAAARDAALRSASSGQMFVLLQLGDSAGLLHKR